jgi:glycosyltransferase involved in cell wall biosynthesis
MSKISIITPTYNRKELLEKAILSVINQKQGIHFDWEMIIIDDGSTDNTREYIQKYLDTYLNIHYIYQENSGVGKARNR